MQEVTDGILQVVFDETVAAKFEWVDGSLHLLLLGKISHSARGKEATLHTPSHSARVPLNSTIASTLTEQDLQLVMELLQDMKMLDLWTATLPAALKSRFIRSYMNAKPKILFTFWKPLSNRDNRDGITTRDDDTPSALSSLVRTLRWPTSVIGGVPSSSLPEVDFDVGGVCVTLEEDCTAS